MVIRENRDTANTYKNEANFCTCLSPILKSEPVFCLLFLTAYVRIKNGVLENEEKSSVGQDAIYKDLPPTCVVFAAEAVRKPTFVARRVYTHTRAHLLFIIINKGAHVVTSTTTMI